MFIDNFDGSRPAEADSCAADGAVAPTAGLNGSPSIRPVGDGHQTFTPHTWTKLTRADSALIADRRSTDAAWDGIIPAGPDSRPAAKILGRSRTRTAYTPAVARWHDCGGWLSIETLEVWPARTGTHA